MAKFMAMAGKISKKRKKSETTPHPGRPTLYDEAMVPVQVNFTSEQKQQLVERARELGMSLATFIRAEALKSLKKGGGV